MHDPHMEAEFRRPNGARLNDYLLGGTEHLPPDREAGDRIEVMFPGMTGLVRRQRAFKVGGGGRDGVVAWLARNAGISQFIDIGCGWPLSPTVHDVARDVVPGARVAYADSDPMAVSLLRAQHGPDEGIAVTGEDVTRPGRVLGAPPLLRVIDFDEPVAVLLCGILSSMAPDVASLAVEGYSTLLAPGSAVAVACVSYRDQQAGDEAAEAYRAVAGGAWYSHSLAAVAGFFAGAGLRVEEGSAGGCPVLPPAPCREPGRGRDRRSRDRAVMNPSQELHHFAAAFPCHDNLGAIGGCLLEEGVRLQGAVDHVGAAQPEQGGGLVRGFPCLGDEVDGDPVELNRACRLTIFHTVIIHPLRVPQRHPSLEVYA